jgi:hypothetical protein
MIPRFHWGLGLALALAACGDKDDSGAVDADGDGYVIGDDCDDGDPAVHPGATELCNGVDDDCDGVIDGADAEDATIWYLDQDGDGWGDEAYPSTACEQPPDQVARLGDCDDTDPAVHPDATELCNGVDDDCDGESDGADAEDAATWYMDQDGDGYGDATMATVACERPDDHSDQAGDCNDYVASVHMDADELCNGVDDDCDGQTDEDDALDAPSWYPDADADGYGDVEGTAAVQCSQPSGRVEDATDCDDGDDGVHPGAEERCDGVDSDCDGTLDEDDAVDAPTWYADADADGYGDAGSTTAACAQPSGFTGDSSDCDDGDPDTFPGADERCDGHDDDCDGSVDEDDAVDAPSWYADADGDGFGDASDVTTACSAPTGTVADSSDCDDGDGDIFPGAAERCDDIDSDCDGQTHDDDALDASTWYADADADGFGDAGSTTTACSQPSGHTSDDTDCDDGNASAFPGADEWCDGIDNDCDGSRDEADALDATTWHADVDADGYGTDATSVVACTAPPSFVSEGGDCADGDPTIHPGADEHCDGVDTDCDGVADEDDALDASTWYADVDGDGFGDPASTTAACTAPSGYGADDSDCDDDDPDTFPGADEWCDGTDTDCDGVLDEDDALDATGWASDGDGDGWGDSASAVLACSAPTGTESPSGDCDDADPTIHPGADEWCDGIDTDCDGDPDLGALDGDTWYTDADADGFGDADAPVVTCSQPSGTVSDSGDCDDGDAAVHPGADEHCDGVDEDCDGDIDEEPLDGGTYYADADGDGYGDAASPVQACGEGSGLVADDTDCDDTDPTLTTDCSGCGTPTPWAGDLSLTGTTASTDAATFCASYNVIEGDLSLDGTDLVDLEELECLCQVDGGVTITGNGALGSLQGLRWMSSVGGDLTLTSNTALADLKGLDSLTSIGGDLSIASSNVRLVNYVGLDALAELGGSLGTDNPLDPAGLEALVSVGGDLEVELVSSTDCGGLGSLESVGGVLTIRDAPSFVGLEALHSVGGDLILAYTTAADLTGLDSLVTVGDDLELWYPTALVDLTGLTSLTTLGDYIILYRPAMDNLVGTALTSINGVSINYGDLGSLEGLEGVTGSLRAVSMYDGTLGSFTGLDNATALTGGLWIYESTIGSLEGLDSVASITEDIHLENVDGLVDFNGLGALTTIGGDVHISDVDDLVDFSGLESLTSIGGYLYSEYSSGLTGYEGLGALTSVGGSISSYYCTLMNDYVGLESLTTVGGSLTTSGMYLDGLESLTTVGGSLWGSGDLTPLSNLESIGGSARFAAHQGSDPLPALHTVGGQIYLISPAVTTIDGFDALTSLGSLEIECNSSSITAITAFGALTSMSGTFELDTCFGLYSFDGLPNLTSVGGSYVLYNNTSMYDWDGTPNLTTIGGSLYIGYNYGLGSVTGLWNVDTVGGDFTCQQNGWTAARCEAFRDNIGVSDIGGTITIDE